MEGGGKGEEIQVGWSAQHKYSRRQEKFLFRLCATMLAFPFNDTQTTGYNGNFSIASLTQWNHSPLSRASA